MLKWEDNLRSQPSYVTAAVNAANIFVASYDDPEIVKSLTAASGEHISASFSLAFHSQA